MDYPSPNFIRPNLSKCEGVSVDESSKLTIRLHYNPVMDEWLSLTDEVCVLSKDTAEILFELHKDDGPGTNEDNDEIIKIGNFLEVN